MNYKQCFICREWTWDVCVTRPIRVDLCLPCYVDVLEVRQRRGVPLETDPEVDLLREGPDQSPAPSRPQLELF